MKLKVMGLAATLASVSALSTGVVVAAVASPDGPAPLAADVLAKGSDVPASSTLTKALSGPIVSAYAPDLSEAVSLKVAAGEVWLAVPAGDGGLCIQVPSGGTTCAFAGEVQRGILAITTLAATPADQQQRLSSAIRDATQAGGGTIAASGQPEPTEGTRRGVAPEAARRVQAVGSTGGVTAESTVDTKSHVYVLSVGLEGAKTTVRFLDGTGSIVGEVPAW